MNKLPAPWSGFLGRSLELRALGSKLFSAPLLQICLTQEDLKWQLGACAGLPLLPGAWP